MRKIALTLAALPFLVIVISVLRDPIFFWRFATYPRSKPVTTVEWYQPRDAIAGSEKPYWPQPIEPSQNFSQNVFDDAVSYVSARNSTSLIVLHKGRVAFEWYAQSYDNTSVANSMSMAKTLQALAVGVALEEGKLTSINDPVLKYLSEWAGDSRGALRIKDLLTMTSGLNFDDGYNDPFSDITAMHGRADAMKIAFRTPLGFEPGTHFDYKNVDPQILGEVLVRATGRRYADYVSEKIWKPIHAAPASIWLDRSGGNAKTYCCIFATARDWALVGQLMLAGGRAHGNQIVSTEWITKMTTPNGQSPEYGYFTWLFEPSPKAGKVWRLDGRGKQRVYVVPKHELVIVRTGENSKNWDDKYLVNLLSETFAQ